MLDLVALILQNGGFILWPIAATSIAALTVAIERLWRLLPLRARFAAVKARFNEALLHGGAVEAQAELTGDDSLSRVLLAGLAVREHGAETVRAMALDAAQREVPVLERGLGVILGATQVAPLLGLLGTVIGLIDAFHLVSDADVVTTKVIAGGIYKALGATAAGLLVAIPSFLAYSGLSGLVGRLADQLEHAAANLPLLLQGKR